MCTGFLIDREDWDFGAGAPCCNLSSLINQSLNVRLRSSGVFCLQNDAQVLGHLVQSHDIFFDVLGRAVVVVHDGGDLIRQKMP